ncbi:LuxR C-terminal-related transcriptional regulator [Paeniglutamicibacter psychrophenolicus]|uniref:DNA-binding CsgD family transcriptional regulator n=1 Tax=Paeniglutamicibacter psychrophenolicus TaxID=257454 RepID=A0ABS4W806_9MICC|nr:DNA-binding CsgD family transcriptional regulator [Paeniglutamicibacter psychrophenolicus]
MATNGALEQGRESFAGQDWKAAHRGLSAARNQAPLDGTDLLRLAIAAYLLGFDAESRDNLERAYHGQMAAGRFPEAVRAAFWLVLELALGGDVARAQGWMANARRLLPHCRPDCAEQMLMLIPEALFQLDSDPGSALVASTTALEAGERLGDAELLALGILGRSQALIRLGRIAEALPLIDEAMLVVTRDPVCPIAVGIVYCAAISECQDVFDLRRAREWTEALGDWCDHQPDLVPYRGQCLVHRAQLMRLRGELDRAAAEAARAADWLARPRHPALGMAHYELGELERIRGDAAQAERHYGRAHGFGVSPQPGLGLLRLDQDRPREAAPALERALAEASAATDRARLLPAAGEALLAVGRLARATELARELAGISHYFGSVQLQAEALLLQGRILLAQRHPEQALALLSRAREHWSSLGLPLEVARTRLPMSEACRLLGDAEGARMELDAARASLRELGAAAALGRAAKSLEAGPVPGPGAKPDTATQTVGFGPISPRETEVLRLVATGMTNRQVAQTLFLSEKTVARHLSNIYTKIGVENRAAATAYAYDRGIAARAGARRVADGGNHGVH